MNPNILYKIALERQAEIRREAEMERMARGAKTGKPIAAKWKLPIATVLAIAIIVLMGFLGN